ncbi:MAG: outer membrane beta-barrel protein [Nitrospira sp.]|nr:outer membrane beta-barrel protein [Nitrospira sp.]
MAVLAVTFFGASQPALVHAETKIVPSAAVSGRYDSNIFRRPAQFLPAGTQTEDFATTIGGAVGLLHETRDIDVNFKVGGSFNAYVENTNFNFFTANVDGIVGLDRWVDQYVRGARLRLTQHFLYTPETPGFVTGGRDVGLGLQQDDLFLRGIQTFRANTFINTTTLTGAYPVSRDLSLEGGYTFGLRRVGQLLAATAGEPAFFNTMSHTWHGGPRYRLTKNDSVAVLYRQSFITQSRSTGGRTFNTNFVTLAGDYTKVFQEWTFTIEGGITFIEPASRTTPSGSMKITTRPERDTVLSFILSREARPSYFLQGGATISNLGRVAISHTIYERLTLDGTVAYGYNELFPSTDRTFKNFTASSGLSYKLTRNIAGNLFYIFTNVDADSTSLSYQFSRHQAGIAFTAEWN